MTKEKSQIESCLFRYKATGHGIDHILFRVGGTQNKTNIISIFSAIISPPELIQAPL